MIAKTAQIGYNENGGKIIISKKAKVKDYAILRSCKGFIIVGDGSSIGYYVIIHGMGGVTIGRNVMLSPRVQIYAQNHGIKKGALIKTQKQTAKGVNILDDVWVGAGTIITDNVTLNEGCVVGAGSVVTKNIPPYEIWAGNPARKIGERK